ncbi:MAG: ribonuclease Y [Candidatus Vogelbacteria bacterium]|nr:ribonuclease Y [Candidatus Vogelbacteria bacterium]
MKTLLLLIATSGLGGVVLGYFLRWLITLGQKGSVEIAVKRTILEAKDQAQKITDRAEKQSEERLKEIKEKERAKEDELKKKEERLLKKDELLDKRQLDIDRELETIKNRLEEIKKLRDKLHEEETARAAELERVAKLTAEEARTEIIQTITKNCEEDFLLRLRKLETAGGEKLETRAKEILAAAIQRLANSTVTEITSSVVAIPSDDVKGKIIGKEGRNIRAFEKATGVEVIIDDTPGAITLSSFDPVRRQIAKAALENLILDGRIHPAKIEEMVEKAKENVAQIIKDKGEQASYEANVFNLDPRIILILGRLHFRTSYGQNVLQHSVEMAHIAGMLAEELGADPQVARAGALLHDLGKAVDHEVSGTHVEIGKRILEKFGVDQTVIKAMRSHHGEYPYETLEAIIVQTADAISGGRPGARRDSIENYLRRLKDLENLANSFPGIEKAYAIQAGREIRVFVKPQEVGDFEVNQLARNIALRIEQELKYPGEIKVTVIRESRVIEYAR